MRRGEATAHCCTSGGYRTLLYVGRLPHGLCAPWEATAWSMCTMGGYPLSVTKGGYPHSVTKGGYPHGLCVPGRLPAWSMCTREATRLVW